MVQVSLPKLSFNFALASHEIVNDDKSVTNVSFEFSHGDLLGLEGNDFSIFEEMHVLSYAFHHRI